MTDTFRVFVQGKASSQGSKVGGKRRDGTVFTRPATKTERPWRQLLTDRISQEWDGPPWDGALELTMTFAFVRPKSGEGKKRPWPSVRPDGDKLQRAVQDALKLAGAIVQDSHIVSWVGQKVYRDIPGVEIELRRLC
jgi:Holliday junction resolvase RusA-like endonuclease